MDIVNYTGLYWVAVLEEMTWPEPSEYPSILPGIHKDTLKEFDLD